MRTTTLGVTGPDVGVIGLGCMGMSYAYDTAAPRNDAASIGVIHRALDLGMTLIETADAYGPYTNEELVGRALSAGRRERAVLATKVGFVIDQAAPAFVPPPSVNGRPEYIRASIDGSLRRLSTEYVDLYQLHRVDPGVPLEETWGAMAELVQAGKVRHIGLSAVTVDQIAAAQAVHPVTSVQSNSPCGRAMPWTASCPTAGSRESRSCPTRRWDAAFSPAGSLPPMSCPGTTSGAGCRGSSGTRCASTWP